MKGVSWSDEATEKSPKSMSSQLFRDKVPPLPISPMGPYFGKIMNGKILKHENLIFSYLVYKSMVFFEWLFGSMPSIKSAVSVGLGWDFQISIDDIKPHSWSLKLMCLIKGGCYMWLKKTTEVFGDIKHHQPNAEMYLLAICLWSLVVFILMLLQTILS